MKLGVALKLGVTVVVGFVPGFETGVVAGAGFVTTTGFGTTKNCPPRCDKVDDEVGWVVTGANTVAWGCT